MIKLIYFVSTLLSLTVNLTVFTLQQEGSVDQGLKIQLEKEALTAWTDFNKSFYNSIRGKINVFTPPLKTPTQVSEVIALDGRFLIKMNGLPPNPERFSVFCKNKMYGFRLVGNDLEGWTLTHFSEPSATDFLDVLKLDEESPVYNSASPLSIGLADLPRLFADSSFRLTNVHRNEDGYCVASFELKGKRDFQLLTQLHSGTITLDPKNSWMPISYNLSLLQDGSIFTTFNYALDKLLPVSSEITQRWGSDWQTTSILEYDWSLDRSGTKALEFTLGHFGLPDPKIESGFPSKIVLFFIGFIFFITFLCWFYTQLK